MSQSSTPVLYTFGGSVWAAVPELALRELGYSSDTISKQTVNLVLGENFKPDFIKINPNATLPTLEADGKAYTSTTDVTAYLVQNAPKKVKAGDADFIKEIHEDSIDPNFALLLARNQEELAAKAAGLPGVFLSNRQDTLAKVAASIEGKEFEEFYADKIAGNGGLLDIYRGNALEATKDGFFQQSQDHFANVGAYILKSLPQRLPEATAFLGGDIPGEDDFHLGAWLARIAATVGAIKSEEGLTALKDAFGAEVPEQVAGYWKAWSSRDSWKDVYGEGLH
ncbi:hypothetical protein PC9H_003831 [Pleurotus ostreatus]|uniref:GST N-terminal domain-containing protein n=1 Tax=Pleurotus ostreatus TaxID=5322 RepID=A0A8H7A2N7_PLEOS|nr:uncharacterized protein PC9H_003831 [Pleurotus ostreatus]KAF7436997.1 hypothetical protein PC9H_003831 [Pleurotus ostreatus]KAJ8702833.1 hypothetical protein PTI98_001510 [Pleurotus ostreatus]